MWELKQTFKDAPAGGIKVSSIECESVNLVKDGVIVIGFSNKIMDVETFKTLEQLVNDANQSAVFKNRIEMHERDNAACAKTVRRKLYKAIKGLDNIQ